MVKISSLDFFNIFDSKISESKICEAIPFYLRNREPVFIASSALMNLDFQALNFVLLNAILDSFPHVYLHLRIHLIYVELSLSYDQ